MNRPNDERGFVHKKIGRFLTGAVGTALGGVPIVGGVAQTVFRGITTGGGGPGPSSVTCGVGFRMVNGVCVQAFHGGNGGGSPCRTGESARCCKLRNGGINEQRQYQRECVAVEANGFGGAEMGRFGAGLQPAEFQTVTRRCPRGAVLAVDGLCYNRRDLKNADRMWPRGRRPLLTGGDLRCIAIAARAATKFKTQQKRLQRLGMLPKATSRRAQALPRGHHAHVAHD